MLESIFIFLSSTFKSVLTFFKILISSSLFIKQFKTNKDRIVIMGNGPSLKNSILEDIDILSQNSILGVNNLPSTPAFELLKPSFFIIVSEEFWVPGKIKKHQEVRDKIISNLIEKTKWPLVFFLPVKASHNKQFISSIKENKNISISYYNKTPVEGLGLFNNLFFKLGWGMPRPHNVLVPSIFNCINAGFKKIYLIGADHSWIPLISVDKDNNALVNFQHFYDEDQSAKHTMHRNSKSRSLHEILEKFMLTFKAYFILSKYAKTKDVEIYNCTPGSFIDAFERIDIKELEISNSTK